MNDLFHQTLKALETAFTCELIASPLDLEHGVFSFPVEQEDLLRYANKHGFSRIPLRLSGARGAGEITHVATVDLEGGTILENRLLTAEDLTSGSTPISRAIELLAHRRFYFVLTPHHVGKVITVSDLNRLPVRTYLYTLLSHLEAQLSGLILQVYGNDEWINALSPGGREAVRKLHALKQQDDFDTRLIDCTTLTHKLVLAAKLTPIREALGHETKRSFERAAKPVQELRNRLAHGLLPIGEGEPPPGAEPNGASVDTLRDHIHHSQPLNKPRNPEWLAMVTRTVRHWIELASQP